MRKNQSTCKWPGCYKKWKRNPSIVCSSLSSNTYLINGLCSILTNLCSTFYCSIWIIIASNQKLILKVSWKLLECKNWWEGKEAYDCCGEIEFWTVQKCPVQLYINPENNSLQTSKKGLVSCTALEIYL